MVVMVLVVVVVLVVTVRVVFLGRTWSDVDVDDVVAADVDAVVESQKHVIGFATPPFVSKARLP